MNAAASDQPRWYVVQTRSRQASRADENLRNQNYTTYLPQLQVEKIYRSKRIKRPEPLFPNYLFIRLCAYADDWRPIRSTRGVLRLVEFGGEPAPIQDAMVDEIRRRTGETPAHPTFRRGEHVEITAGPFRGLEAIFEAFDGEERVILLLNLMQQQARGTQPLANIRRA